MSKIQKIILVTVPLFTLAILGAYWLLTQEQIDTENKNLPAPTVIVKRTEDGYEPKEVTIKKGEVVLWENDSSEYHWPASDLHPTHAIYSAFDPLRPIPPGEGWAFQFDQAGTWKYHDHIRANKVGTVTVVE